MSDEARRLRQQLHTFVASARDVAPDAEKVLEETDPVLSRRLRDLGYIE
jgi:hypothetical protein